MADSTEQISFEFRVNTPAGGLNDYAGESTFKLQSDDIHVWSVFLDADSDLVEQYREVLSQDECNRAQRFKFTQHRNRYITARRFLRILLGKYLECGPAELTFAYGPFGKPFLVFARSEPDLNFNLAHSQNLALIAITRSGPVGVDLEQNRFLPDCAELVERFFSARENSIFQTLPEEQQSEAFFNLWTRKEAWLKATGEGISHFLNRVEVSFVPGAPARLVKLPEDLQFENDWFLHELVPGHGFTAALASAVQSPNISCFKLYGESARRTLVEQ